jgi:ATP-dependent Clp protease ATP-binding subunit ClpC
VLGGLGVTIAKARAAAEATAGVGTGPVRQEPDLSAEAKDAIECAIDEAKALNHHFIGTEHILLAILRDSQGNAVRALEHLSLSPEHVREQVIEVLQRTPK